VPGPVAGDGKERRPRWSQFDPDWYLAHYPEVPEWMEREGIADLALFYEEIGQRFGHSPNRFFDENWYRQAYPDVYREIAKERYRSGFAHYCVTGYLTHDPNWLFSEGEYRRRYPAITLNRLSRDGLWNGYDHYLEVGARGFYQPGLFFDADLYGEFALERPSLFSGSSLFEAFLGFDPADADAARASWYFDPVWYLEAYPDVRREIAEGRYRSALHHYLTNDAPTHFNPQEWFSEAHYAETSPDVMPSVHEGHFRNAYDHFIRFGSREGRSPRADIDLRAYLALPRVRADVRDGLFAEPFAHWVASRLDPAASGLTGASYPRVGLTCDEGQTRALFVRAAEALLPGQVRRPSDFRFAGLPELSVIIVAHDQLALTMATVASLRANYDGAIDLIIVDSGSRDQTRQIEVLVPGAQVVRFRHNAGYLEGCNAGLPLARAPAVLLLNNDIRFYPDAVAHMVSRLHTREDIGAVGAKIIRTNARLQEAGSIVWRDGATYGYRREDDPNLTEANFVRDVDYCSAACLMVRTELLRSLGGYDTIYRPAYFEDADLCLRMTRAGARIVYDPQVVVEHLEFGSSGTARSQEMIKVNHRVFARQHGDFLRQQQPAHVRNAVIARERRGARKHILFIEDRLPLRSLGSGYVRSNDVVRGLAALGHHVTVFPVLPREVLPLDLYGDFPDDVELISDRSLGEFADFIQERAGYYDLVWIGRIHNMARLLPIMNEVSRYLPTGGAVLDTEVVATPRTIARAEVLGLERPAQSFDEMLRLELESAHFCQQIVAVTEADAALVRRAGYDNVSVLGHALTVMPTPSGFGERRDVLFVGALHDEGSPNHDGLIWFIEKVLPVLDPLLPADVRFTVVGFTHPSVDLSALARHPRVDLVGAVADLAPIYDRHRVFVAPTRFAGGLPYKVHEAAAYGIPVVATELLVRQVGWESGRDILSGGENDAEAFARAVMALYGDEALWEQVRESALDAVGADCAVSVFREALDGIVERCMV